jgi:hypothetical protein
MENTEVRCIDNWLTFLIICLSAVTKYKDQCEVIYNLFRNHVAQDETCICAILYNHDFSMELIMSR